MRGVLVSLLGVLSCAPGTGEATVEAPAIAALREGATPFVATDGFVARDARLPEHAAGTVRLGGTTLRALDVANVRGSLDRGAVVYRNVAPSTDAMWIARPNGIEELRVLRDERAAPSARWGFDGGVRVEQGAIVVSTGLRSAPLYAIDARGTRRDLAVKALDAHTIETSLDANGLVYPIVIDPLWVTTSTMSVARTAHQAVQLTNGDVLVVGRDGADVWDSKTGTFVATAMAVPRVDPAVIAIGGGRALVVGGSTATGTALATVEVFDTTTRTWSATASLSTPRVRPALALLETGDVLAMGGADGLTLPAKLTVEAWSPTAGTWTARAPMKTARTAAAAARLSAGKVLVAGGRDGASSFLASSELYNPATDSWAKAGAMPWTNHTHLLFALPGGRALTVDGQKTALFDNATDTWTEALPLEIGTSSGAALLANGFVLATGGRNMGTRNAAELFDPATSKWTKILPMIEARAQHTVTALADGRALIAGGSAVSDLATAELYVPFANGEKCALGGECRAGNCVDGVCCDTKCKGDCEACNVTDKVGTCSPVTGSPIGARSCAPYKVCTAGACDATCKADADCTIGNFCEAGTCTKRRANGGTCTRARECTSNFCVDGVCCNTACDEVCEACDGTGSIGTCSVVTGAPHGARKCLDAEGDGCRARTCNGIATAACRAFANGPGTQCKPEACAADRYYKPSTCDGAGTCKDDLGVSCSPFACAPGGCRTACTADAECAEGFVCRDAKCVVRGATCTKDGRSSIDPAGAVRDCGGFRCGPAGTCLGECGATVDCADGLVCDTASRQCTGGGGGDDGGCTMGRRGESNALFVGLLAVFVALLRRRVAVALVASGTACAQQATPSDPARELVGSLRGLPETAPGFTDESLIARADGFVPPTNALDIHLPAAVGDPLRVGGVAIAPPRAAAKPRVVGNAVVFTDVEPGCDLVYTATRSRAEEIWVFRGRRETIRVRETLSLPAGAAARVHGAAVEVVDHGVVRLASEPIVAIDARGVRRLANVAIAGATLSIEVDAHDLTSPIVLDPAWGALPVMSVARFQHTATKLADGSVLVVGGSATSADTAVAHASVERFNPTTRTWSTTGSLSAGRRLHAAALLASGKVLVSGGFTGDGTTRTLLSSAELYDPVAGTWSAAGAMKNLRDSHAMVAIAKGALAVGRLGAEVYDAATNTWAQTSAMSVARPNGATATVLPSGKILVAGGTTGVSGSGRTSTAEIYDPATDTWTTTGSLSTPRAGHEALVLSSGKVLVIGGIDALRTPLSFGELYDEGTKTWTKTANAGETHVSLNAALVTPDRLLVVGGPTLFSEVWTPSLDTWVRGPAPALTRGQASLTALGAGVALHVGGGTATGPTASAELYEAQPLAAKCGSDGECASGFCRDGVCCNSACTDSCSACDLAGSVGTCGPVTGAPHPPRTGCGLYACAAGKCGTSCTDDGGCGAGSFCDAGKCIARKDDGRACTRASMCTSGHCVDGFCCESACTDVCASCGVPGREGTCSAIKGAAQGGRKCDGGGGDACKARRCDGIDTKTCVAFAPTTVTCAAAKCEGSQFTPSPLCDGMGTCGAAAAVSCAPYTCTETGCRSKCSAPEHCVDGHECVAERCVPKVKRARCTADGLGSIGIDDVTRPCGAYLCAASGACATRCTSTAECAGGFVCQTADEACVSIEGVGGGETDDGGCSYGRRGTHGFWLLALALLLRRRRSGGTSP